MLRQNVKTTYHDRTPEAVKAVLEAARQAHLAGRGYRVRIYYGDTSTGECWGTSDWAETDTGYIGRSVGRIRIPLCLHNARSLGGGAILSDCIVRIEHANKSKGGVLYSLPNFHRPN